MRWTPSELWDDGDTFLTSGDDRAGTLLIVVFAGIMSFWLFPGLRARVLQAAHSLMGS